MAVYVIMPVFNRLGMTQAMLSCLREQVLDEELIKVIVDDGSTDGTGVWLAAQDDLTVLHGDGELWWGGGIDLGLRHVFNLAGAGDWVAFVNNDTWLPPDFLQTLLDAARRAAPAAVGSVIRGIDAPHALLSVGPRIDAWRLLVGDKLEDAELKSSGDIRSVDALSGRGVLFPVEALRAAGGMRPTRLPHYLADYELSLRVRSAGWALLVSMRAAVYSAEEYGNAYRAPALKDRLFSRRSPTYLPALASFWWEASNWRQKITLPFRILAFTLYPPLRKKNEDRSR